MAIEALHHNLFCSEVEITFDGYSTSFDDTRCLYDAKSRDTLIREDYEEKNKNKNFYTEEEESEGHLDPKHTLNKPVSTIRSDDYPKSKRRDGFEIPLYIDGKKIVRTVKKMKIKRLFKDDGTHASIPI